ncbi:MAG: flagellar biosynthetic protein FliO [Panacagrimonas sp.]
MDGAGTVLQMVLSLTAVVVMILGLAWMTRRMQGLRVSSPQDLRVKATLAVGIKERVVLIEAQGQQFLIGVAPGQVSMLKALGHSPDSGISSARVRGVVGRGARDELGLDPDGRPLPNPLPQAGQGVTFAQAFAVQLNKLLGR